MLFQSNKMSSQDLKDVIAQMSTSQADKTKVLQATANLDEVTGFCSAMGTLFQQMSKTAEMEGACFCLLLIVDS